uniref:NADH dehydrogenase subunit 4L n=1 Tax=Euseius sacchari TaxID=3061191 RepID=A0AAU6PCM7_9ACAR
MIFYSSILFLFLFSLLIASLMSIIFFSSSILVVLVSMEALILSIFCLMIMIYSMLSCMDVLLFLVAVVGESILGLVLMVLKLGVSGEDFMFFEDVI